MEDDNVPQQNYNHNIDKYVESEVGIVYRHFKEIELMLGMLAKEELTKKKESIREVESLATMIEICSEELKLKRRRIGLLQVHPARQNPYSKEYEQLKRDKISLNNDKMFLDKVLVEFKQKLFSLREDLSCLLASITHSQSEDSGH